MIGRVCACVVCPLCMCEIDGSFGASFAGEVRMNGCVCFPW